MVGERLEGLGQWQHFVHVAHHSLPAKIADAVHNLRWTSATVGQIAAVKNQVGRSLSQVGEDSFEGGQISMDVGYDGDAHRNGVRPPYHQLSAARNRAL